MDDGNGKHQQDQPQIYAYRSLLAQVAAAFTSSILLVNVAGANVLMSLVNNKLTNKNNAEAFKITTEQASWYSGLQIIMMICGGTLGGYILENYGRKRCMLICTIPQMASYILVYYSSTPYHLYASSILGGLGGALGEVAIPTYISEISTSRLRGRLFFLAKFGYAFGSLLLYSLSSYYDWRRMALITLVCPMVTACYLTIIPESPFWLLSKNRNQDALKSLCWLRGWVPTASVGEEFLALQQYVKQSAKRINRGNPEKTPGWKNLNILLTKEFLKPYGLVTLLFFLSHTLSLRTMKPYLIMILNRYELDLQPNIILVMSSAGQILGAIAMVFTINRFGKRKLIIWSYTSCAICVAVFGVYVFLYQTYRIHHAWILYITIVTIYFLTGYVVGGMPWFICGEIYPQRLRGLANGISVTTGYLLMFLLIKTFFSAERLLNTYNLFFIYATVGIIGTVYLYVKLPETENKTLEEIEKNFQRKDKSTDAPSREVE